MKAFGKVVGMALVAGMALSAMTGCRATKDRYYYCTKSGHTESYIRVDEGSTSTDVGSGYAYKAYNALCDTWLFTGEFTYDFGDSSKFKMKTGRFKNYTLQVNSASLNGNMINIEGISYRYRS